MRQFTCQMADAEFLSTSIVVANGDYELRTRGRIVKFEGFQSCAPVSQERRDVALPDIK